jgi:outer membrane lipoprotein LolB
MTLHRFLIIMLAAALTACVSAPELKAFNDKPTTYVGRFTVSYQKNGEPQREQGGFEWKIQPNRSTEQAMSLALISPLGSTLAVIAFDPQAKRAERASLTSPSLTDSAPDLESLMERNLGWRLPLADILPWVSTTPPAQTPANWVVAVPTRYGSGLPRLLTANNDALKLSVRLVFEQ